MTAHSDSTAQSKGALHLGIDGCPAGWVAVDLTQQWLHVFSTLQELWQTVQHHLALALVDIPMGLPEDAYRTCDLEARRLLGGRRSSIFFTPCREAVYAVTYQEANAVNRHRVGKGISIQTWNICGKIREMDMLLQNHSVRDVLSESHPELAFAWLNGGQPLTSRKQRLAGRRERLDLLEQKLLGSTPWLLDVVASVPNRLARPDDILDAAVLSVAAVEARRALEPFPNPAPLDALGIPMQIWVPQAVNQPSD